MLSSFRQSQQQYQALMAGLQNIPLPLTGDDAAVKKYASDVEALKQKIGMPDVEDVSVRGTGGEMGSMVDMAAGGSPVGHHRCRRHCTQPSIALHDALPSLC